MATNKRMKREPRKKLTPDVEVEQRIPSPAPGTPTVSLARDIVKACGYRLGWELVAATLN